ncbi:MAG: alpha-hydroxy acid oxidase [Paracoccaceae bacterium]|nr:alpha-hydroxy acid oxidase [Paracoccaceae bacterium]MDE2911665.1 alpha-hydroxy acid oxidase [Paracoccaceae bacterium]
MTVVACIDDLRDLHRRRVPKMFYEYAESGSWTEQTFRENTDDFRRIRLRQRVGVDITDRSTASRMVGQDVAMPVALAPVGLLGMQSADGEIKTARAAEAFGVPFTLSTMSIASIEDVAANTSSPFWFQLYVMRDREFIGQLIDRARSAGCSALVLTMDLQVIGQRHHDIRNNLTAPPRLTFANFVNICTCPAWALGMLRTRRRGFGNIIGHAKGVESLDSLMKWSAEQLDRSLSWSDIDWIKDRWGGKLIVKGILDPEDVEPAIRSGADALIVSNHGGRQLDGAPSSVRVLPSIVSEAGNRIEVHFDSGIRSGQDVLKACALGATGTYIGRSFVYGLGAMGEAGVTKALEIIRAELDTTMALCGVCRVGDLGPDVLLDPA